MAAASIEVSGPNAERQAGELRAVLAIWGWWHGRGSDGVKVKILLDDGTHVDLSGVDQKQLEIVLDRRRTLGN
jgi:hypothetical protein